jgi:hypothetical protein
MGIQNDPLRARALGMGQRGFHETLAYVLTAMQWVYSEFNQLILLNLGMFLYTDSTNSLFAARREPYGPARGNTYSSGADNRRSSIGSTAKLYS